MAQVATRTQSDLAKLHAERQDIMKKLAHLQVELHDLAEPSADEGDVDAYEREKTWALMQSLQRKLEEIERALQLAERGAYGICLECHSEIDPARLEILPEATLCLKCQREYERLHRRARP